VSDSRELLEKADALLGRYRQGAAGDPDIPVLTEVVEFPVLQREVPPEASAVPVESDLGSPSAARPAPGDLDLLEIEIRTRVLGALRAEIASVLEEPLRVRLEDHFRLALTTLTGQLKLDIEALLVKAVDRAVKTELARSYGPPPGNAQ